MYDENHTPTHLKLISICVTTTETKIDYKYYYMGLFIGIFIPLLMSFLWFYHKIALLVWNRRKPPPSPCPAPQKKKKKKNGQDSATETTVSVQRRPERLNEGRAETRNVVSAAASGGQTRNRTVQVEKKLRTFRIILLLMAVFLVCRLPFWCMSMARLVVRIDEEFTILILYSLSALGLLNCALNPFLYTFLNETVTLLAKIRRGFEWCADKVCRYLRCNFGSQNFGKGPDGNGGTAKSGPSVDGNGGKKGREEEGRRFSQRKFVESPMAKLVLKNERRPSIADSINGTYREIRY